MRFKFLISFAVAAASVIIQAAPVSAQAGMSPDELRRRAAQEQQLQQQQLRAPGGRHFQQQQHQPQVQPQRPQYVPQPHVQHQPQVQPPRHRPQHQPHWGGRPHIIPMPVPHYIDRPVYVQPEPQYYSQPRYYEEEPQYRPRRAVRKRQVCRTVWAKDDYGRRYKVKRCRARR